MEKMEERLIVMQRLETAKVRYSRKQLGEKKRRNRKGKKGNEAEVKGKKKG